MWGVYMYIDDYLLIFFYLNKVNLKIFYKIGFNLLVVV